MEQITVLRQAISLISSADAAEEADGCQLRGYDGRSGGGTYAQGAIDILEDLIAKIAAKTHKAGFCTFCHVLTVHPVGDGSMMCVSCKRKWRLDKDPNGEEN